MGLLACLLPLCGALIIVAGAFFAVHLRALVHNRSILLEAERKRVRVATAKRLLASGKRKSGTS